MSTLSHDQMVAEINSGHTVTYRGTKITDVDDVPSDNQIAIDTAAALQTRAAQNPNLSNALVYKGVIDCSANPNYPAADAGHSYIVSVAGKIGGASGVSVEVGDMLICKTDGVTAGTQAQKGAYWNVVQGNLAGPIPVKAIGAEINTGTDDEKYVTPKAIADSDLGSGGGITNSAGANVVPVTIDASGNQGPSRITDDGTNVSVDSPLQVRNGDVVFARVAEDSVGALSFQQAELALFSGPTAALAGLGAGNVNSGTHSYKVTLVTDSGESDPSPASNVVTTSGGDGQVSLSDIGLGSAFTIARKIYRTAAGGSTYKLLATIADNTTTTYADNIADASLGANAPTVNTAVDARMVVSQNSITLFPTLANTAQFLLNASGTASLQADEGIAINSLESTTVIGDTDGSYNGTQVSVNDLSKTITAAASTESLVIDGVAHTITMLAANGVSIVPPTSDPHIAGALWNNAGTPTISAG